jgi:hypothetical protein
MDEPPRFDEDGDDEVSGRRLKHHAKRYEDPLHLQERFFRYGIRPEWLQVSIFFQFHFRPKNFIRKLQTKSTFKKSIIVSKHIHI